MRSDTQNEFFKKQTIYEVGGMTPGKFLNAILLAFVLEGKGGERMLLPNGVQRTIPKSI